jgi:hypothetical protein
MTSEIPLEQALERCLAELDRDGDIETALRRFPQYAGQLRSLLELAQATRQTLASVPAAPGGLVAGRARLLAAVEQQRAAGHPATAQTTSASRRRPKLVTKFAAALLAAALCFVLLGSGVIWAAQSALPGDLLYVVKLATEDALLAWASAPGERVDLALDFVQERADEMRALVAADRPIPQQTVARMERHLERALIETASTSDAQMTSLLTQISTHTQAQEQQLERVRATAPPQAQARLEQAVQAAQQGAQAAARGLADPETFRRQYRQGQKIVQPTDVPDLITATPEPSQTPSIEPTQQPNQEQNQGATPEPGQEHNQNREQEQNQEATIEPSQEQRHNSTATPSGASPTPSPEPQPTDTPPDPKATPTPHNTPAGPHATDALPGPSPGQDQGHGDQTPAPPGPGNE